KGARPDIGADEFTSRAAPIITDFTVSKADSVLSFQTLLGVSYNVEGEANPVGSNWSVLLTNIPGTGGVVQVTDATPPRQPSQFYRVRMAP
ncbi:MAG TPA: hypothetical protein VL361_22880, partial [Candidatus Limnocylindrales bacterium]|nr:hypothetical protein [Candidatus Limnocylindrales bacterium]